MKKSLEVPRRHFLRGTGGFLLAIPFLDSLLAPSARAAQTTGPVRWVNMMLNHGGAIGADMHPSQTILTDSLSYAGQVVRRGDLDAGFSTTGGVSTLSPILSGNSSTFTSTLLSKMNVLRGLATPFYPNHHQGGHMGNWGSDQMANQSTLDQAIAFSPNFYQTTPRMRVMVCADSGFSWSYENPSAQSGNVIEAATEKSSLALFNKVYVPPATTQVQRGPVVDKVLEDYKRLRASSRVSAQDRLRLDAHISHVAELQKKLESAASCGTVATPNADSENLFFSDIEKAYQLFCDVIAVAFSCDTSRIAVLPLSPGAFTNAFCPYPGDYHSDVAHQAQDITPAKDLSPLALPRVLQMKSYQRIFEKTFLYLASKLDDTSDGSGTLLDSSLITWTHESGTTTHDGFDFPVVMAGSARGALKTGNHVDYRNMAKAARAATTDSNSLVNDDNLAGLAWHQYLGTVTQAMGLQLSNLPANVSNTKGGYGQLRPTDSWYMDSGAMDGAMAVANDFLPFLKA